MTSFTLHIDQTPFASPLGKIVCVGRNYAAHAAELNNPLPVEPLLFIKPATAAVELAAPLLLPAGQGSVHHELELAVLIAKPLRTADATAALAAIGGIGLGIDLTLREVQDRLKRDSHPWERAKAFDASYPVSAFMRPDGLDLQQLHIQLWRNGTLQQDGNTADMLFPVAALIAEISRHFSLLPGDIVSTGTPAGVGPLQSGDTLRALLRNGDTVLLQIETRVQ